MLSVHGASVSYQNFHVLKSVDLVLEKGVFHSLIGPNGAGKTTLIGALSGHLRLTTGSVEFEGRDITAWKADKRCRSGIGRSFQKTNLFPTLTARQNVELAALGASGVAWRHTLGRVPASVKDQAMNALQEVGLKKYSQTAAAVLSHGDKRKLELAMLLSQRPKVLLLDEPTAGMSLLEASEILQLIASLRASGAYAVLLVEHKLEAVMRLSDIVTVLSAGEVLATGTPLEMMRSPEVQKAYLGGNHGSTA